MFRNNHHEGILRPIFYLRLLISAALASITLLCFILCTSLIAKGQSCPDFQFGYCSATPTTSPNSEDGKIILTGPAPANLNWLLQVKTITGGPYPGSFVPQLFHMGINSNCSQQLSSFQVFNLKAGTYQFIMSKTGSGCKDTVVAAIEASPCNFQPSILSTTPASSSIGQDGQAIFSANGPFGGINALSLQYRISRNGGAFISGTGNEPRNNPLNPCVSSDLDSMAFFPTDGQLIVCGLNPGAYRIILRPGYDASCTDTLSFQVGSLIPDTVARPVVSLPSGTYSGNQVVSITAGQGAEIYYTTNGNVPLLSVPNSFTKKYTSPITIFSNSTLRAIAVKENVASPVVARFYTITNPQLVERPTVNLAPGSYSGLQQLSLTCATPEATIYYTTNGMVPIPGTVITKKYTGPIRLENNTTIRAIGTRNGYIDSPVMVASYAISNVQTVAAPVFGTPPGVYGSLLSLSITCATPGAVILYTTNGMTPFPGLFAARVYSTPLDIASTTQIKARAFLSGFVESPIAVGQYTIAGLRENVDQQPATDKDLEFPLVAFPNPVNNQLKLHAGPSLAPGSIRVMNMLGKLVYDQKLDQETPEVEIDLAGIPGGVYWVIYQSGDIRKETRIIKN